MLQQPFPGNLTIGRYKFVLDVSKTNSSSGFIRHMNDSVIIQVKGGNIPKVLVSYTPRSDVYNTGETIKLSSSWSSKYSVLSAVWSQIDDNVPVNNAIIGTDTSGNARRTTTLSTAFLTGGSTYTFQLRVIDTQGNFGDANIKITMNSPPSSGSLSVSPPSGYPFDTEFEFVALGWTDSTDADYPFKYSFTYRLTQAGNEKPGRHSG